jgi:uncharacterized protein (TIGR03086 family)
MIDREELVYACQAVGDLIAVIEPVQWTGPTPCSEWNVRDVVNHLVAVNLAFVAWVSHRSNPAQDADLLRGDLVGAYKSSTASLVTALTPADVSDDGNAHTGISRGSNGAQRLQLRVVDLITQNWDLAQATGADILIPDELAERALVFVQSQLTPRFRRLAGFSEPQPIVANAPAIDRLAAFSGRSVFWR